MMSLGHVTSNQLKDH